MRARRFTVDASWWRHRDRAGDLVIAGSPVRLFRFAPGAGPLLDALEHAEPLTDLSAGGERLVDRLDAAEAIHERFTDSEFSLDDVTIIVPARDAPHIADLAASLPPVRAVVMIDDGSVDPIPPLPGVRIHRLARSVGPAGARNAGTEFVTTDLVLFIDADVELPPAARTAAFWRPLLGHFDDRSIGLVAPRVASTPGSSLLERYEMTESPLDMGTRPARVRVGGPLSYVPSAVLAVRTADLRRIGGFDAGLRYGEDVDLVWRLGAANIGCRYEPAVTLQHHPRSTWTELWRQRFHYGTSAANLARRHPGALAPARLPGWTAATWGSVLVGSPSMAVLTAGIPLFRLHHTLKSGTRPRGPEADSRFTLGPVRIPLQIAVTLRLFVHGHLLAGRGIAQAITRPWWPLMALASTFSRRARRVWLLALVVPGLWRWISNRSTIDPVRYLGARFADDLAYGAGVWMGAVRARRLEVLRPELGLSRTRKPNASAR